MIKIILVYDNMCYVDGLKVVVKIFFFLELLDRVWLFIVKVIDKLYIRNYKDVKCKIFYNLEGKVLEGFNIMVVE